MPAAPLRDADVCIVREDFGYRLSCRYRLRYADAARIYRKRLNPPVPRSDPCTIAGEYPSLRDDDDDDDDDDTDGRQRRKKVPGAPPEGMRRHGEYLSFTKPRRRISVRSVSRRWGGGADSRGSSEVSAQSSSSPPPSIETVVVVILTSSSAFSEGVQL